MSHADPPSTAARAAALARLLAATEPASADAVAAYAQRHADRIRRGHARAPGRALETREAPAGAVSGSEAPCPGESRSRRLERFAGCGARTGSARRGEGARAPSSRPEAYLHDGPTRSLVLNAFLHELGWPGLVPVDAVVLNEHELAPRLFERARRYIVRQLMITGHTDAALALAPLLKPGPNARAARLYIRHAAQSRGALGAIARDYEEHRRQSGLPEEDDRLASCIMAAFAARWLAYAEGQLGPHVRDEVRSALGELLSEGKVPARRRRASGPRQQGSAVREEELRIEGSSAGRRSRR